MSRSICHCRRHGSHRHPQTDRARIHELVDAIINSDDPDQTIDRPSPTPNWSATPTHGRRPAEESTRGHRHHAGARRRRQRRDERDQFSFFVIPGSPPATESHHNATSHGMNAFFDNPAQWGCTKRSPRHRRRRILRWATPVHAFQLRTATRDTQIGGVTTSPRAIGLIVLRARPISTRTCSTTRSVSMSARSNPHLAFGGSRRRISASAPTWRAWN